MTKSLPLAACLLIALVAPGLAQDNPGTSNPGATGEIARDGRYTMTPAPNGFLRLDTRTGAVSLCTLKDAQVTCASSADERGALENEIGRLARENADLRERLAQITQRGGQERGQSRGLPDAQEMDRALGFAETFMKRMMRIMREDGQEGGRL